LVIYSEQLDNASWGKAGATISANTSATLDPSGYNGSDKLVEDSSTGFHRTNKVTSLGGSVDSSPYCISIFAKAAGRTRFRFLDNSQNTSGSSYFDLSNGTVISGTGKIENYGNGWYRCTIFPLKNFSTNSNAIIGLVSTGTTESYTGDGTSGVFFWGAQLEAGSYPTSYIPTLASSVTRVADEASKTGITNLIGQTEGTLFAQVGQFPQESNGRILGISDGTLSNYIIIIKNSTNTDFAVYATYSGIAQATYLGTGSLNDNSKIAVGYANNDYVVYVNGTQVHTDTSASVPTCSNVYIGQRENNTATYIAGGGIKQALLFKTRLSNDKLAALTTL